MKIPGHEFDFKQIVDDFAFIYAYFGNSHTFILSNDEKQKIWKAVEKLLTDNQVEASFFFFRFLNMRFL
ncbi:hypothetical protein Hanom_Chr01g00087021 [Helianthus anomalus]